MISQGKPRPPRGRLAGSRHPLPGGCPRGRARHSAMHHFLPLVPLALVVLTVLAMPPARSLEPLPYNHPGLAVDLGVGLWAWPLPCDADGDGDFDLVVSCPDKPSNGIYLFENASGDTSQDKFPVFKPARRIAATAHYVMPSYVGGRMRVLTPGHEHPLERAGRMDPRPAARLDLSCPQRRHGRAARLRIGRPMALRQASAEQRGP
jgi:hypothetical protein